MPVVYTFKKSGGVSIQTPHDPNAILDYEIRYRPDTWVLNTVYLQGSVVIPTTFCGYYFEAVSSGCSGATEPTFPFIEGDTVADGAEGLIWETKEYDWYLEFNENISTSDWAATESVTIGSAAPHTTSFTNSTTTSWIVAIPSTVESFELKNHIKTSVNDREDDRTLLISVADR